MQISGFRRPNHDGIFFTNMGMNRLTNKVKKKLLEKLSQLKK